MNSEQYLVCPLCGKNFNQSFECEHDEDDLADRIAELEARILLALRINWANFPGYLPSALRGRSIPDEVLKMTNDICEQEEYMPVLEEESEAADNHVPNPRIHCGG